MSENKSHDNLKYPTVFIFSILNTVIIALVLIFLPLKVVFPIENFSGKVLLIFYTFLITAALLHFNALRKYQITGRIFSVVLLVQLLRGLFISSSGMMPNSISIPHPILGFFEPVITGNFHFRSIFFIVTFLLLSGGFCSHLCFLGAWEHHKSYEGYGLFKYISPVIFISFTLFSLLTGILLPGIFAALFFFIISLVLIFSPFKFSKKGWNCQVLCPLGSIFRFIGKYSLFRVDVKQNDDFKCDWGCINRPDKNQCRICGNCMNGKNDQIKLLNFSFNATALYFSMISFLHVMMIAYYF